MKIKSLFTMLLVSSTVLALDSDRKAKLIFEGEGCVTKMKVNQTECQKSITMNQGTLMIRAKYGLITHQKQGIDKVLLKGDQVYMEQEVEAQDKMIIKANEIDYRKSDDKVFLTGNVSITSSIGVTTGEQLEFNLQTQEIISVGSDNQPFKMEIDQSND